MKPLFDDCAMLLRRKQFLYTTLLAILVCLPVPPMTGKLPEPQDNFKYVPTWGAIKVGAYTLGTAAIIPHAAGYFTEKHFVTRPRGTLSSQQRLQRVFEPWRAIPLTGAIAACYVADRLFLSEQSNLRYAMYPLALCSFAVGSYQALEENNIPYSGSFVDNSCTWIKNLGKFVGFSLGGAFVAHKLLVPEQQKKQKETPKKKKKTAQRNQFQSPDASGSESDDENRGAKRLLYKL